MKGLIDLLKNKKIGIEVYVVEYNKMNKKFNFLSFQTSEGDQEKICDKITFKFKEMLKERKIIDLTNWDERGEVIYKYDIDNEVKNKFLELLKRDIEPRDSKFKGDFKKIYGILYKIGMNDDIVVCYSHNIPLNIYSNKLLGFYKTETFQLIDSDTTFKLKDTIDLFLWKDEVYIANLKIAEKNFGVDKVIIDKATKSIEKIKEIGILENIDILEERLEDLSFSRKLMRIKENSPVLKLPIEVIIDFTKKNNITKGFKYSENKKIFLDTKKSQELFLRLLNDDLLHSQLTGVNYLSISKDISE